MLKRSVQLVELRFIAEIELYGESKEMTKDLYSQLKHLTEMQVFANRTELGWKLNPVGNHTVTSCKLFRNLEDYHRHYAQIAQQKEEKK